MKIKKIIKSYLPNRLHNFLLRLIYGYRFYRYKFPHSMAEFGRIREFLRRKDDAAWVVYDVTCSPPTYGDFLMVLMLARFFMTCQVKTYFIITKGKYREDWGLLSSYEIQTLIDEYYKISKNLLNTEIADVLIVPEFEFEIIIEKAHLEGGYVAFYQRVKERKQYYNLCIHLLSKLLNRIDKKFLQNYLLSRDEAMAWDPALYDKRPYITWHLRRSLKWDFHRNMTDEHFLIIFNYLKKKYPDHEIMIVSDNVGCEYFKQFCIGNDLECIFSKNYSNTFIGDCSLILRGDYHFMLNGGGISLISMFSGVPYDYIYVHNEEPWKRRKMTSWSSKLQMVYPLYGRDDRVIPD